MDDSSARDDKALDLRCKGTSFASIARSLGYPRAHDANEAFNRALRRRPPTEQATLRDEELARLDALGEEVRARGSIAPEDIAGHLRVLQHLKARLLKE